MRLDNELFNLIEMLYNILVILFNKILIENEIMFEGCIPIDLLKEQIVVYNTLIIDLIKVCEQLKNYEVLVISRDDLDDLLLKLHFLKETFNSIDNSILILDKGNEEQKKEVINLIMENILRIKQELGEIYIKIGISLNDHIFKQVNEVDILLRKKDMIEMEKEWNLFTDEKKIYLGSVFRIVRTLNVDKFISIIDKLKKVKKVREDFDILVKKVENTIELMKKVSKNLNIWNKKEVIRRVNNYKNNFYNFKRKL